MAPTVKPVAFIVSVPPSPEASAQKISVPLHAPDLISTTASNKPLPVTETV